MRIIVFGGRDYSDRHAVYHALNQLVERRYVASLTIVHGGCTGADALASDWVSAASMLRHILEEPHPADWVKYGKAAGPRRNAHMASLGAAGAVGFPGGAGTQSMASECKAAGIRVWWPVGR